MTNLSAAIDTTFEARKALRVVPDRAIEPAKTFSYFFHTSLKHSNATQNVYFSNFFDWQGAVRERWFYECISPDFLAPLGVFVTKKAHNEYLRETFPFQTVRCDLNTFNIQRCSFYLKFRFYVETDDEEIYVAHGYQQIVFANNKKPARLSDEVLDKIRKYELKGEAIED